MWKKRVLANIIKDMAMRSSWTLCERVAQLCATLCDPMDYTVHGILQARILQWVAYPFFSGLSWPRSRTGISCIAGRFFTNWAIREALGLYDPKFNDKCPYKRHIARRSHRWRKTKSDAAGSHGMPGDMRSRKSKRGFSLRVFRGKEIL